MGVCKLANGLRVVWLLQAVGQRALRCANATACMQAGQAGPAAGANAPMTSIVGSLPCFHFLRVLQNLPHQVVQLCSELVPLRVVAHVNVQVPSKRHPNRTFPILRLPILSGIAAVLFHHDRYHPLRREASISIFELLLAVVRIVVACDLLYVPARDEHDADDGLVDTRAHLLHDVAFHPILVEPARTQVE